MAESELIEYLRRLASGDESAAIGIGDDCAGIRVPEGAIVVATIDSVIEGVHYDPGTPPELVGRKAISRGLSDIAAMAANPIGVLAAVAFSRALPDDARRDLVHALWDRAGELGAPLVGGDIASGSDRTTVTVTALGSGAPDELVTRAGARPGDALCVTGSLGGSLLGHHLDFEPRLSEALALRRQCPVHAMIDISDGLSTDALHLAEESKAGVLIEEAAVPLSGAAQQMARQTGRSPLDHALDDGEDYELLFAVAPDDAERLVDNGVAGTRISRVGRVIEGPDSYRIDAGGRRRRLVAGGWEHGGGR